MQPEFIKITALVFNDQNQLLLVRARGESAYKGLGGKIEAKETDTECLQRELQEEANVKLTSAKLFFETPVVEVKHRPGLYAVFRYYLVEISGTLEVNPEDEIEEFRWITKVDFEQQKLEVLFPLGDLVIPQLIEKELLK